MDLEDFRIGADTFTSGPDLTEADKGDSHRFAELPHCDFVVTEN